jgi:hypothetical protein
MAIGSWSYQTPAKRRDVPMKELLLVDTNMTARFLFLGLEPRTKSCPARVLYIVFCFESFLRIECEYQSNRDFTVELLNTQIFVHLSTQLSYQLSDDRQVIITVFLQLSIL